MTLLARSATPEDYPSFARLFPELRVPDPLPPPAAYVNRIAPHAFFVREVETDEAVAYGFWQCLGPVARVIHVVVGASAQGRGVGRFLMGEIARRARERGCERWTLNVKPDNARAIRLYERSGMQLRGRAVSMQILWSRVAEIEGESGLIARIAEPADDERIERELDLLPTQLATLRKGGGWSLIALHDGARFVGFAAFEPSFPGAHPFRVIRPSLARPLLEAMRPHARPDLDYVRFVAEHTELEKEALSKGGVVVLEFCRMDGPIPAISK